MTISEIKLTENNYLIDIDKLEEIGLADYPVYNIEVKPSHTYVVNNGKDNIIVHNCRCAMSPFISDDYPIKEQEIDDDILNKIAQERGI